MHGLGGPGGGLYHLVLRHISVRWSVLGAHLGMIHFLLLNLSNP